MAKEMLKEDGAIVCSENVDYENKRIRNSNLYEDVELNTKWYVLKIKY